MCSIQLNHWSFIRLCHVGVIRGLRPRIVDAQKVKTCFYAAYARFFATDDDFKVIEGNHQEIFGTLQKHYGYTKEQVEKAVYDFKSKH